MIVAQWTTFFETELRCNSTFSGQMIYLNTSQDDACEEGRLGFLLEKGEIFNSSKLSVNLLIFMTSCNNLITCTVSSPPAFPTHWTSNLGFKADDVADLTLWTGWRPRASISLSKNRTCYFPAIFLCLTSCFWLRQSIDVRHRFLLVCSFSCSFVRPSIGLCAAW